MAGWGCTKCTKEEPEAPVAATSGEPAVGQVSVADLLRAALTELGRGEGEAARALLCRALDALADSEAGR